MIKPFRARLIHTLPADILFRLALAALALSVTGCECEGRISFLGSPDSGVLTPDASVPDAGHLDGGMPKPDAGPSELFWARRLGGNIIDEPTALSLGPTGLFVVGFFNADSVFADGEPGQATLYATDSKGPNDYQSSTDAFIVKYATDGRLLWARSAGGISTDLFTSVDATAEGGAVVVGRFDEPALLGAGEPRQTTLTGNVLARYNADGSLAWALNPTHNAVLVAETGDGALVTLGKDSNETMVLAKYDASGANLWSQRVANALGTALSTFSDGSLAIAGSFKDSATFDSVTLTSPGNDDAFAAKYGADGSLRWVTAGTSSAYTRATGVAALASGGMVVVGTSNGAFDWGATTAPEGGGGTSNNFVFVTALAADGAARWSKTSKATGPWGSAEGKRVSAFSDGSVVVTGNYDKEVTFSPADPKAVTLPGSDTLNGRFNVFFAKYSSTGQLDWARRGREAENAVDIAVSDNANAVFSTGGFCDRVIFDVNSTTLTSSLQARTGGCDIYLVKYAR